MRKSIIEKETGIELIPTHPDLTTNTCVFQEKENGQINGKSKRIAVADLFALSEPNLDAIGNDICDSLVSQFPELYELKEV